ncbi:MAG: hypothetical protein K1X94_02020 [Sandaracinaceae bacterium]|nr:hypothetical protein [Sandaracinaceae bacterium]
MSSRLLRSLALALGAVILAWLAQGSSAHAQLAERRVGARFVDGVPRLDVSVADFASDPETRRKLTSGLPQTLQFRAYAYTTGRDEPVAVAARSCRVVYDLWEERFRVQLASESGDRTISLGTIDEVVSHCLVAERLPVGRASDWAAIRGRRAYFAVAVELNPLTPDTVQRIRRWLARPQRGAVDSDSFFGSFVSLFVNRGIGAAERSLRFRSQDVEVP